MNIADLKKLDLKNLDIKNMDVNRMLSDLGSKKDALAQGVVILVSLFVAGSLAKEFFSNRNDLNAQTQDLNAKLEAIKDNEQSAKRLKAFMAAFPKILDEDAFPSAI